MRAIYLFVRWGVLFGLVFSGWAFAGELVLLSDSFDGGVAGKELDGARLDNQLGGQVQVHWIDPGKFARYAQGLSGLACEIAPAPWDRFKILTSYQTDSDQIYALECRQKRPEGLLNEVEPWNAHSGLVVRSKLDQQMTASGIVLRLHGSDPHGKDFNEFSVFHAKTNGRFFSAPALTGTIEAADLDAEGYLPVRLEFAGSGTSRQPLVARLYFNRNYKGGFVVRDLSDSGDYFGIISQSSRQAKAQPSKIEDIKLSILEPKDFNRAPNTRIMPIELPIHDASGAALLRGKIADDGAPTTGSRGIEWQMIRGPAPVRFGNAHALLTSVTLPVAGIYTVALTGNDGQYASSDSLTLRATGGGRETVLMSDRLGDVDLSSMLVGHPLKQTFGSTVSARWIAPNLTAEDTRIERAQDLLSNLAVNRKAICDYRIVAGKYYALDLLVQPQFRLPAAIKVQLGAVFSDSKGNTLDRACVEFDAAQDRDAAGSFAARVEFTGIGTPECPLRIRLFRAGQWVRDFSVQNMDGKLHVGFQCNGFPRLSVIAQFKLSELVFPIMGDDLMLHYSTLGYDARATKRALLGLPLLGTSDNSAALSGTWRLLDAAKRVTLAGTLKPAPRTYGEAFLVADFSEQRAAGEYTLEVTPRSASGEALKPLRSEPFLIEPRLHYRRTFEGIALANAEARQAPPELGGGYFDCNSSMGEAYAHGAFLAGLAMAQQCWGAELTPQDRQRLRAAAVRAVDYLLLLHDANTGEIQCQYPTRMQGEVPGDGLHNTFEGLWGLAWFAVAFKDTETTRTAECYRRCRTSLDFIKEHNVLFVEQAAGFWSLFHAYDSSEENKQKLFAAVDKFINEYNLRTWNRGVGQNIPNLAGLYYCFRHFPDDPRYARWLAAAHNFDVSWYQDMLTRNAYQVIPLGNHEQWDNLESVPPGHLGPHHFYPSSPFGAMVADAAWLAEMTGDRSLESLATGALGWLTGLNPGIPGEYTIPPGEPGKRIAAALMINLPKARHVRPWDWFAWKTPVNGFLSIVNGFNIKDGQWYYDNLNWPTGETFIKHDGSYLFGIAVYDAYLRNMEQILPTGVAGHEGR